MSPAGDRGGTHGGRRWLLPLALVAWLVAVVATGHWRTHWCDDLLQVGLVAVAVLVVRLVQARADRVRAREVEQAIRRADEEAAAGNRPGLA